uniref:Putative secreted protein n=1 Tax=Anopheles darlingi TaxID=43151 RepID=A0A2M4DRN5_ANODA
MHTGLNTFLSATVLLAWIGGTFHCELIKTGSTFNTFANFTSNCPSSGPDSSDKSSVFITRDRESVLSVFIEAVDTTTGSALAERSAAFGSRSFFNAGKSFSSFS